MIFVVGSGHLEVVPIPSTAITLSVTANVRIGGTGNY